MQIILYLNLADTATKIKLLWYRYIFLLIFKKYIIYYRTAPYEFFNKNP